jgi:serine/threonine-protein kinase
VFFFKKRKPDSLGPEMTLVGPLIDAMINNLVLCRHCQNQLPLADLDPLSEIPCPHCNRKIMVPMTIGNYYLYRHIGGGGMGRVYKAVSEEFPDERFAVKILPEGFNCDDALIDALYLEAEVASELYEHPNVIKAVEFGMDQNNYFFASEFVMGQRWDDRVFRHGRILIDELMPMILDLIDTVRFIYQKGLLYRDLKPENVIIRRDGTPIMLDFGLCMKVEDAMFDTEDAHVDGAPHFMPPERLTGEGESVWSEIYSLGMLMYYSLTGQTFFEPGDVQQVAERYALEERDDYVLSAMSELNPALVDVVMRSIQRDPALRPKSFDRLERELRAASGF